MELKMLEVFKVVFKTDKDGKIAKSYTGIIKPSDYNDIEMGLSMVIQHIYLHKMTPLKCFGKECSSGNLLEIIFCKNAMGDFNVDSAASELTVNDCENVLTGLIEILVRLHLERMAKDEIKITRKKDDRTSSVDFTPASSL
ncbi:MAG: hypothetical protein QQN44_01855, partial [Nitrosopumilus sp.]